MKNTKINMTFDAISLRNPIISMIITKCIKETLAAENITVPCEIDFMCLSSYGGTDSTGNVAVKKDLSVDIKGRHVVILEDIYDTGNSLDFLYKYLQSKEPASLIICTLLDKPERRKPHITLVPDYVGFTIPNEFVVGYGLDFNEHYRNLPFVGVLKPEAYAK